MILFYTIWFIILKSFPKFFSFIFFTFCSSYICVSNIYLSLLFYICIAFSTPISN
jgi:hypothetical protein